MIYFLQKGKNGPIKIGRSNNVKRRVKQLQSGSAEPLNLIMTLPESEYVESELHDRFSEDQIRGEWFESRSAVEHFAYLCKERIENPHHWILRPAELIEEALQNALESGNYREGIERALQYLPSLKEQAALLKQEE